VYDVDDMVDLFSGGVLLPEAKLMIGYYALFQQGWVDPLLRGVSQKF
jgi:hypothetical protein